LAYKTGTLQIAISRFDPDIKAQPVKKNQWSFSNGRIDEMNQFKKNAVTQRIH
jgi:hypothetical protein